MRKDKIDRAKVAFVDLQPITLHFDGTIEPREIEDGREYTMELFRAYPGDLVVAKIDLKNGAVGIVPKDYTNVCVTGHFAVYSPNTDKIVTEYLRRIIQAKFFKDYLWRNKVGAEGRKEVKLDFFESAQIPLPEKSIQHLIVDHWQKAQDSIGHAQAEFESANSELDEWLYSHSDMTQLTRPCLSLEWDALARWDIKSARAASFRLANPGLIPFGYYAEEAAEVARPKLKPDKEWPVYGVNNKEGVFFAQFQKGSDFNTGYKRVKKDWFFHNPTRSAVGSLGIVPEVPDDAITSPEYQVWRLRDLGEESLLPQFVATLIRTSWFIKLIQFHRVGAVKQRLYVENLLEIPVPRFPSDLQKRISITRFSALEKLAMAKKREKIVRQEVEEMILGTRPVLNSK